MNPQQLEIVHDIRTWDVQVDIQLIGRVKVLATACNKRHIRRTDEKALYVQLRHASVTVFYKFLDFRVKLVVKQCLLYPLLHY